MPPKNNKRKTYPRHLMRRNAAPVARRLPRPEAAPPDREPLPTLDMLWPPAAGAAGVAVAGTFLAKEGWHPKTIATFLAAAGAFGAWQAHSKQVRGLSLGAAAAALGQLIMMMWPAAGVATGDGTTGDGKAKSGTRQAAAVSDGALAAAFERARRRLALDADEADRYGAST